MKEIWMVVGFGAGLVVNKGEEAVKTEVENLKQAVKMPKQKDKKEKSKA